MLQVHKLQENLVENPGCTQIFNSIKYYSVRYQWHRAVW